MMDQLTDPREMRKVLDSVAYRGQHPRADYLGKPSYCASIVRACMESGRYRGMAGEDIMTMIAYSLLLQCEQLTELAIANSRLDISPRMMPMPGGEG